VRNERRTPGSVRGIRKPPRLPPLGRRVPTPFKAKVALAAIKGEETLAQLATAVRCSSESDRSMEDQLLERAADAFNGSGHAAEAGPDIKTLHAKIGQLALENDFLVGALGRSPGSSAKR
jgi:transposase